MRIVIKLHAQTAHRENGQSHAHEVFVHHFRLPRRGEEMAHSDFCYVLHSKNYRKESNKNAPKRERLRKEVLSLQAFIFSRDNGFHRTIKLKGSIQLVSLSVNFSYCTINQIIGFCL